MSHRDRLQAGGCAGLEHGRLCLRISYRRLTEFEPFTVAVAVLIIRGPVADASVTPSRCAADFHGHLRLIRLTGGVFVVAGQYDPDGAVRHQYGQPVDGVVRRRGRQPHAAAEFVQENEGIVHWFGYAIQCDHGQ